MKILLRSTASLIVFFLFSFFSIHPLSISSCDRLYIYSKDTTYHNSVSLNCLFSGPVQKKGWIFFQGPQHISPHRIEDISNESIITIDTTRFPVGDYQVQCMTMSGQKLYSQTGILSPSFQMLPSLPFMRIQATVLPSTHHTLVFVVLAINPCKKPILYVTTKNVHSNQILPWNGALREFAPAGWDKYDTNYWEKLSPR